MNQIYTKIIYNTASMWGEFLGVLKTITLTMHYYNNNSLVDNNV